MPKGREKPKVELDFDLGGLFKGVGNFMDLVAKMAESGREEFSSTGEIQGLPGKAKGVYGFTVRMGLGGLPKLEEFGNIKKSSAGPVVAEEREPIVDILDEVGSLLVIVELPGVEEKDIHLEVQGDILNLSAKGRDCKYSKEVLLPSAVEEQGIKTSLRNGLLEIRLIKKQPVGSG